MRIGETAEVPAERKKVDIGRLSAKIPVLIVLDPASANIVGRIPNRTAEAAILDLTSSSV